MANVIPALVEMQRNSEQTFAGGLRDLVAGIQQYKGQKEQDKLKELGQSFIQSGDYSPEGIQTFAKNNKVSPREMASIVQLASAFEQYKEEKDPLVPFEQIDESGAKSVGYKRRSELTGGMTKVSPAKTETYYDKVTGRPVKVTQGQDIPANAVPDDWHWKQQKYDLDKRELDAHSKLWEAQAQSSRQKKETPNQKIARSKLLAKTLGWTENGYDKDGNPLPDKITYYNSLIANGNPMAKAALDLEYSVAGLEADGEGNGQKELNIFTGKTATTKNDATGEDIEIMETKDGLWVTEIAGKLYEVKPNSTEVSGKTTPGKTAEKQSPGGQARQKAPSEVANPFTQRNPDYEAENVFKKYDKVFENGGIIWGKKGDQIVRIMTKPKEKLSVFSGGGRLVNPEWEQYQEILSRLNR
jgi:hypothetical protein